MSIRPEWFHESWDDDEVIGEPFAIRVTTNIYNDGLKDKILYVIKFHPDGEYGHLEDERYQVIMCPHNYAILSDSHTYKDGDYAIHISDTILVKEKNSETVSCMKEEECYE